MAEALPGAAFPGVGHALRWGSQPGCCTQVLLAGSAPPALPGAFLVLEYDDQLRKNMRQDLGGLPPVPENSPGEPEPPLFS